MTFNRERERLDDLVILFNDQSFSMSKESSNNILSFKFSSDEIGSPVDLDSTMSVNLSNKRDLSLCNREIKMALGIHIFIQGEVLRKVCERFPEAISEDPRKSCTMFFLSKSPMRFFIMVIPQESFTSSFKSSKGRAIMSSKYPFLPKLIKTLNRGIPARFSRWDKHHVDTQKQMEADDVRKTIRITPSSSGTHLIIHLGYSGNTHEAPCFGQMSTHGYGLFIRELTCVSCMTCHIHSMKGVESGNPIWAIDISGAHKVCLIKISHLLGLNVRIRLVIVTSFGFNSSCLSMTREDSCDSGKRCDISSLSLLKLPMNNLCPNPREVGTRGLMGFQFFSNGKDLFNQTIRRLSPDSFRGTTLIFESFNPLLFRSFEPFREPSSAPLDQLKYFIEAVSFIMKLYCFATCFIFILILHRLLLLPKVFGRSLSDVKISLLCYDIFKVYDVMI